MSKIDEIENELSKLEDRFYNAVYDLEQEYLWQRQMLEDDLNYFKEIETDYD